MNKQYVSSLQKKMFRYAFITSVFTEFTQIIALTVDSLIVCIYLGELEIGAVGIAGPFFYLVGIPACCLASGLQTLCAQEMGRGRVDGVGRLFSETVSLTGAVLLALTAIVALTVPGIAWLFGARGSTAEMHPATCQYLYGLTFEIVPFVLMSITIPVVTLDNGSRTVMLSSIAGCLTDIILDIVAVTQGWGLFGIGLASSMSALVSFLVLLTHFLKKKRTIRFKLAKIGFRSIWNVIRTGLSSAFHSMAGMIRSWLLNMIAISAGGSVAMSLIAIHGTILDFVDIAAVGIAGAVGVLASIGLKTVCALAKEFNYYRVYGMNTTMIRLEQPD